LSDCPAVRLSDCPIFRLSDCPIVGFCHSYRRSPRSVLLSAHTDTHIQLSANALPVSPAIGSHIHRCLIARVSGCPIVRLFGCPIVRLSDCPIVLFCHSYRRTPRGVLLSAHTDTHTQLSAHTVPVSGAIGAHIHRCMTCPAVRLSDCPVVRLPDCPILPQLSAPTTGCTATGAH
jgi:hypothetical protein